MQVFHYKNDTTIDFYLSFPHTLFKSHYNTPPQESTVNIYLIQTSHGFIAVLTSLPQARQPRQK